MSVVNRSVNRLLRRFTDVSNTAAPIPTDESARLADLHATGLLGTSPEEVYEATVRTAAFIADTPIALITLLDDHHQWFKAGIGLEQDQTDRKDSFCIHALATPDTPLVVPDATLDARFLNNPLVLGAPHIRFYCGVPIVSAAGRALGTLCVIDRVPRELEPHQLQALRDLAGQTSALIQKRTRILELEGQSNRDEAEHIAVLRSVRIITEVETDLDSVLECSLEAIVQELNLSAGGLWWRDGENLAVDGLWVDPSGAFAATHHARRGVSYPTEMILHQRETATRHGADVLPSLIMAALQPTGIVASYAVPIIAGSTIIGAYELIPNASGEPSARCLLAATQAAAEVGRWIERDRAPEWIHDVTSSAKLPTGHYEPNADEIRRRATVKTRLAGAVARGDLSVVYEPIVRVSTRTTVAVEVLARWQDAELGAVCPAEFIPAAEQSGAILEIGRFVRRQALSDLPRLDRCGGSDEPLSLWVNVSPREIDTAFAVAVLEDLAASEVIPQRLTLEITERLALDVNDPAIVQLIELAEHGVGIAIDDFGVGFTSLAQLRALPLTQIKIDRSYMADLMGLERDRVFPLVQGIVHLGQSLGLTVVVEGIENEQQFDAARAFGTDLAQGHLFALAEPISSTFAD